jgi:hypothetical protein
MKNNLIKYFCLIGFCLSGTIMQGQDIFPLQNAKWTGIYTTCVGVNYISTYFSYIIQGDTVVDNITRSKCYYIPDIDKTDTFLIGYFHVVDSIVYFQVHQNEDGYYSIGLHRFCDGYNLDNPLYDFSLEEGDVFSNACDYVQSGQELEISVSQIEFGGKMRKKIVFGNDSYSYWVEGMGSNRGFFDGIELIPTSEDSYDYICFSVNDEVLYLNPAYSECPVSQLNSIRKITTNRFTIFPNPMKSTASVQSNQPLSQIQIYNAYGALVLEQVCNGELQTRIDKQSLSPGTYFVKCISQTGNTQIEKLIIQ